MANLSDVMVYNTMLKRLDLQAKAAAENPAHRPDGTYNVGGYSPDLWLGTPGAPVHTCDALLRRGLAVEGKAHGFRTITINDAGRAAMVSQ